MNVKVEKLKLNKKEYNRLRHLQNKERNNRKSREYYYTHHEERKMKAREWKKKNRERCLLLCKKWRQENKARVLAYKKAHPEKREIKNFRERRRRVRKEQNGGNHTWREWQDLKTQHDFTCVCCNKKEPEIKLTEDHIIPISKGGSDSIENIQPLCQSCNSKKRNEEMRFLNPKLIAVYY